MKNNCIHLATLINNTLYNINLWHTTFDNDNYSLVVTTLAHKTAMETLVFNSLKNDTPACNEYSIYKNVLCHKT